MKNTKITLRVVFCLVLTLVMVLSMASCDNMTGAFENIANGNFKGAWGSLIGSHEFASEVTPPTCTEKGYTTFTCGKCGYTYVDDYVDPAHTLVSHERKEPTCKEEGHEPYESCSKCDYTTRVAIPKIAHSYVEKVTRFPTPLTSGVKSKMCTGCGIHTDTPIEAVTFTLPELSGFLKSLVGTNVIEISAEDAQIILIDEIVTGEESTYDKQYIAVKTGYLEINGEGENIYALFNIELGIASYDSLDQDAIPTFENHITVDVIVNGEDVSVAVTENEELNEGSYNLSEVLYTALASSMNMTYDQFKELVYVGGKANALIPLIQGIVDTIVSIEMPEGSFNLASLLSLVVEIEELENGAIYRLNFSEFAKAVKALSGKTVTELIDAQYGAGTAAKIEGFLLSLPTLKIRDIADVAVSFSEKYGASLDEVYALINYVVYTASGQNFNIESEIISRYDMTLVGVIAELTDGNASEMTISLTMALSQIVDTVKSCDIDQIYNLLVNGEPNYSPNNDGNIFRITEALSEQILLLNENVIAEIGVSNDGTLESFRVFISGKFDVSVGKDDDGYDNVRVEIHENDDVHVFSINDSLDEFAFVYTVDSYDIVNVLAKKNELGEIDEISVVLGQVVTIGHAVPDSTGENYIYVTEEKYEKVAEITYKNNGDGTHTVKVEANDSKHDVQVDVTETEEALTVTGTINSEYYFGEVLDSEDKGSFTYVRKLDGTGVDFALTVDTIIYDYTENFNENGDSERIYDYDNPKRYDVFDASFAYDSDGNVTLYVDSNNVSRVDGVSDVKNGEEIALVITTTDEEVVIDFSVNDERIKLTVSYSLVEIVAEDPEVNNDTVEGEEVENSGEETVEPSYTISVDAIKFEYYREEELSLLVEASAIKTESGYHYSFNIEGFEYEDHNLEYVESPDGDVNVGWDEGTYEEDTEEI